MWGGIVYNIHQAMTIGNELNGISMQKIGLFLHGPVRWNLGKDGCAKLDEFSEKFQMAFDPCPLIYRKLCCKFLSDPGPIIVYACH